MTTQQCLGRLTVDKGNIPVTKFSNAPKFGFFLPKRCGGSALTNQNLCATCSRKTETLVAEIPTRGINNIQNQSDRVHGLVTEPVPDWSRLYGGKKIGALIRERGYTVDDATMINIEEAFCESVKGLDCDIMKIIMVVSKADSDSSGEKKVKKPAKKADKPVEEPVSEPIVVPVKAVAKRKKAPVPVPEPVVPTPVVPSPKSEPSPKPKPKRKPAPKPNPRTQIPASFQPQFIIDTRPLDISELSVAKINVKKTVLDERELFLSSTGEIYDLKFKHIGRYNQQDDTVEYEEPAEEQEEITSLTLFSVEA